MTWAMLVVLLGGGIGWLAWLGPPPEAAVLQAEAAPGGSPGPGDGQGAGAGGTSGETGGAGTGSAEAATTAVTDAAGLPAAPAPPPLPDGAILLAPGSLAASPAEQAAAARIIPAPDPDLLERGRHGMLPRIGPAGRSAIRTYGRPFDRQDPRPRVGLIVGGLGLNAALAEEAIRRLPGGVTLAFSPYAPQIQRLLELTRAKGMEVLVALPLEPTGYPLNNPGDRALLTSLTPAENQDRLDWVLSRFAGYVGAVGAHGPMRGERFALLGDRLGELQRTLAVRGLLYVDPRPGAPGPARAWGRTIDLVVDEPATRGEIERKLAQLERIARERGTALGYAGEPSPVLVERVATWGGSIEGRGVVLAPVSALIRAPTANADGSAAAAAPRPAPRAN